MYTVSVDETLAHLDAIVAEGKQLGGLPALPVGVEATG
jgi:hypothetical protein